MKKFLVVFLSMLLVVGISFSASAMHQKSGGFEYTPEIVKAKKAQIVFGGQFRFRGEYADLDFDDEDDDEKAAYDGRVRLKLTATISPNTMGVIELETGDDTHDTYGWGPATSDATGIYKEGNSKRGSLTLRQAYVAHQGKAIGTLAGFKVGHMLLKNGNGLFLNHSKFGDDAIILWVAPVEKTEIAFTTAKFTEGSSTNDDDDADLYVLSAEGMFNGLNLGADISYISDDDGTVLGTMPALGVSEVDLWNIGLRADTDLGGIKLKGDVEIQTGDAETPADTVDFDGWALLVGAEANVGAANVRANFAWGNGDEADTADYEGFVTTLSNGQKYSYIYEYKVPSAAGAKNTGLNNTWYINVGASARPMPDVKVSGDIYYLRADEDVAINGGTPDDDLGVELDGKLEYQIDTNLVWYVEAGILFAGDAYDFADRDADDPYSIRHGIIYKF